MYNITKTEILKRGGGKYRLSESSLLYYGNLGCWEKEDFIEKDIPIHYCDNQIVLQNILESKYYFMGLSFHVSKKYLSSKLPRKNTDITLVTQCSLDRLHHLKLQIKKWNGILSVAVWIPINTSVSDNKMCQKLVKLFEKTEKRGRCRLDVALVFENDVCFK